MTVPPKSFFLFLRTGLHFLSSLAVLTVLARGMAGLTLDQMSLIFTNAAIFLAAGYTGIFVRSIGYNFAILIAATPTIIFLLVSYFKYDSVLNNHQMKEGSVAALLFALIGIICTFVFVVSRIWKYVVAKYKAANAKSSDNRVRPLPVASSTKSGEFRKIS